MSSTPDKPGPEAGRGRSGRRHSRAQLRRPGVGGGRQHPAGPDGRAAQALLPTTASTPRPAARTQPRPTASAPPPASPGRRGPGALAPLSQAAAPIPPHGEAPHSQLALAAFLPVLYPLGREQRRHLPRAAPRARMEQRRRRVRGDGRAARNRGTRPRRAGRRRGGLRLRAGAAGRCRPHARALEPRGGEGRLTRVRAEVPGASGTACAR